MVQTLMFHGTCGIISMQQRCDLWRSATAPTVTLQQKAKKHEQFVNLVCFSTDIKLIYQYNIIPPKKKKKRRLENYFQAATIRTVIKRFVLHTYIHKNFLSKSYKCYYLKPSHYKRLPQFLKKILHSTITLMKQKKKYYNTEPSRVNTTGSNAYNKINLLMN